MSSITRSPCQRTNGSANARRSPSKALNEVLNLCQVHWKRPQRVLQDRLGRWHEKTYPLWLDNRLYICGYSPSTNQAGGCGRLLCHKAWWSINIHSIHTVTQTTTTFGDGSTCALKSQCIIKQMTTHRHKTRGGSSIVAVGSAHGAEARGCQCWDACWKVSSVRGGIWCPRRWKAHWTRVGSTILSEP